MGISNVAEEDFIRLSQSFESARVIHGVAPDVVDESIIADDPGDGGTAGNATTEEPRA